MPGHNLFDGWVGGWLPMPPPGPADVLPPRAVWQPQLNVALQEPIPAPH